MCIECIHLTWIEKVILATKSTTSHQNLVPHLRRKLLDVHCWAIWNRCTHSTLRVWMLFMFYRVQTSKVFIFNNFQNCSVWTLTFFCIPLCMQKVCQVPDLGLRDPKFRCIPCVFFKFALNKHADSNQLYGSLERRELLKTTW